MKRLYLHGWEYNANLIIKELEKIVLENGGRLVSEWETTLEPLEIVNRSLMEVIAEKRELLKDKTTEQIEKSDFLKEARDLLEKLEKIKNDPVQINHRNYTNFYLDGFLYSVDLEENPFFDDFILKVPCDEISPDGYITTYRHYLDKLAKDYLPKEMKSYFEPLTQEQIQESATRLYNKILSRKNSEIVTERRRVKNILNDGYHYERIKIEKKTIYKILKDGGR